MAFVWKEEYSIGLKTIDEQHKKFIVLLNDLSQALLQKDSKETLTQIFNGLEEYGKQHLAFEEECFKKFDYSGESDHSIEHQTFRERVKRLKQELQNGDELLAVKTLDFMESWLIEHILVSDAAYVSCFREHGME